MAGLPDPLTSRSAEHPVQEIFLRRWSPRAMSGAAVSAEVLSALLEAARWAPSSYNEQEWRFLYAMQGSSHWETFLGLLTDANQAWCRNAGILVLVASKKTFTQNGKPNPVHSLDTGMAVQNFLLQAAGTPGIVAHPMAGFDRGRARAALAIPEDYEPECMIAVGQAGDPDKLPDALRAVEKVSGRKRIQEFSKAGTFDFPVK